MRICFAQLGIEGRQRLVEQQHLGLLDQRAGQRNALALPAGKLVGHAVGQFRQLHLLQRVARPGLDFGLRRSHHLEAIADIVEHGHMRETPHRTGTPC